MQSEFQRGGARINIKLMSVEEVDAFLTGVNSQGAVFVTVPAMLKQFQSLILHVGGDFSGGVLLEVEVLSAFQMGQGFSAALGLKSLDDKIKQRLRTHLKALSFSDVSAAGSPVPAKEGSAGAKGESGSVDTQPPPQLAGMRSEHSASDNQLSPVYRIKEMDVSEKFRLSMTANRAERAILLRDRSAQVLMGLLSHPRLSEEELLQVIRSAHITPNLLQRISKEKKWVASTHVCFALVRNAKTPPPVAVSLLAKLKPNQLRAVSKMMGLREQVRRAAIKHL